MELTTENGEVKIKLSLGENHKEPQLSIVDATRVIEEFDIWIEIKGSNEVKQLKKLFQTQGVNVTKFAWDNWSQYQISAADIIEMLNYFPKLEYLKLSSWSKKFTGDVGKVNLPHIKSLEITECNHFIIDFVINAFADDSIENLTIFGVSNLDNKLCKLVKKQTKIKRLNIHADLKTVEPLTQLNLDYLRCILKDRDDELEQQRAFLRNLIKSQVNLTTLDLFNEEDYTFSFVTDLMFADICALSKLHHLSISIDSLTSDGIKAISKLTSLKHLTLKIFKNESMEVLSKFSAVKNSTLESINLDLCYEVPAEIYKAIGQNYSALKSLRITLAARYRISFFAKTFPNLETFSIKYGKANDPVEFTQVYDPNDDVKSWRLKYLKFDFFGSEAINTESFIEFLSFFPILRKLKVDTKFEFSVDFINKFTKNLRTIKSIKLLHFEIRNEETFNSEIIDALKMLQSKLDSVSLVLLNIQRRGLKNDEGSCYDFSYQPIINALKDIYDMRIVSYSNIRVCEKLVMHAGAHEPWE